MTTAQLIIVSVAIFVAAVVQVVAGFGFSLLCMPIMTLAVPVEQAVVVSTLLAFSTTSWQSWFLRHDAQRALVRRTVIAAYVGMPLGLVVLNVVPDRWLRLMLGVAVLLATWLLLRRLSLAHAGPSLDYSMGFLSGVLNTSMSTNGPPLVFDLQARHLPPAQFRATLAIVFAISSVGSLSLFVADGKVTHDGLIASLIAVPAWGAGQLVGWPLRKHLHGERFRYLVLALLALAGTLAIVFALV